MSDDFEFLEDDEQSQKYGVEDAIEILKQSPDSLHTAILHGLSDLDEDGLLQLQPVWDALNVSDKRRLLRHLVDISEVNFDLDYGTLGFYALRDGDAEIRQTAIDLLWIDESIFLLDRLMQMAVHDDSVDVRAAAASELGRFILLGEYDDINQADARRAQDIALKIWNNGDEEIDVRRRALEAISNSSHDALTGIIQAAYDSGITLLEVSALYAMGKSCDNRWAENILKHLDDTNPAMRYEATRASGELELQEAIQPLARLALSEEREIQEAAIWSLGEIGGATAVDVLQRFSDLEQFSEDDSLSEAIDEALANANLGFDLELPFDFTDGYDM